MSIADMSAERWQRLNEVFDAAAALDARARPAYVADACANDDVTQEGSNSDPAAACTKRRRVIGPLIPLPIATCLLPAPF